MTASDKGYLEVYIVKSFFVFVSPVKLSVQICFLLCCVVLSSFLNDILEDIRINTTEIAVVL